MIQIRLMNRTYRHITNIGKANRKALRSVLISAMLLTGVTTTAQVTVNGNVYGGGNLAKVHGTVTVTINQDGAQVVGDVYGGGAKADVNTSDGTNLTAGATTTVTLTKGTVRDVYGGGHGDLASLNVAPETGHEDREANVFGAVTVNVNGGSARNVYGCNNLNGTPKSTVAVTVNGTAAHVDADEDAGTPAQFAITGVYGGGNLADYEPTVSGAPVVTINNCASSVEDVFGGGNAA